MKRSIILIAHDMRSCHNVGSLLRTAEGLGIEEVYLSGYTPYPHMPNDTRLPHLAAKIHKQISKTALGAERSQIWQPAPDLLLLIEQLLAQGYQIVGLEQAKHSIPLPKVPFSDKVAILLGTEVTGLTVEQVALCSVIAEIPMFGSKESFNVVQAAAMALYQARFY